MRESILLALAAVSLAAQIPPNCSGVAGQVDSRCACVKDPNGDECKISKALQSPPDFSKWKNGLGTGAAATNSPNRPLVAPSRRQQQARVVPLAHKDYLRVLHPNAQLAVGIDFEKLFRSPELMAALFSSGEGDAGADKLVGALKEMDHLWLSFEAPGDVVMLMTGRFEQGVTAGMFYAQGIRPVFLGGPHAMMIGSEASLQAALDRLSKPAANGGWVTQRARELSKDHETWIVTDPPAGAIPPTSPLAGIRRFAMGVRLTGTAALDGEVIADSDAGAQKIAAWVDQMKTLIREKTGVGALDSLTVERAGSTLKFAAKDDGLLAGDAGKKAMNSEVGVELYGVLMAGIPGVPRRIVAEDKLLAVKAGMPRQEVLTLLGPPLSVASIQGLDTPRETWTYQIPFGKRVTMRLDDGVVTATPH